MDLHVLRLNKVSKTIKLSKKHFTQQIICVQVLKEIDFYKSISFNALILLRSKKASIISKCSITR